MDFLWYDLETWGTNTSFSGIASFACQRTDRELQPIEDPINILCKPSSDSVIEPEALLVHGINPLITNSSGIQEYTFARKIHTEFNRPDTCIIGFNNIRFDDEFCRSLFYKNLLDPYSHQFKNNNSRWDIIDVLRTCAIFKPDTFSWLINDKGNISFKLQDIAANNNIKVTKEHDALSDVQTTIKVAKILQEKQPTMFDYLFSLRKKQNLTEIINKNINYPFIHISGMFPAKQGHLAVVMVVACDPIQQNKIYVVDLLSDINLLLDLSYNELRELIFTPRNDLPLNTDIPRIKAIHLNRCPIVLPYKMLGDEIAKKYGIDKNLCIKNMELIKNNKEEIQHKIQKVFSINEVEKKEIIDNQEQIDVNQQLYTNFFSSQDRYAMNKVHSIPIEDWFNHSINTNDERIPKLWLRLKARYDIGKLDIESKKKWQLFISNLYQGKVANNPSIIAIIESIKSLKEEESLSSEQNKLLDDYNKYLTDKAKLAGINID